MRVRATSRGSLSKQDTKDTKDSRDRKDIKAVVLVVFAVLWVLASSLAGRPRFLPRKLLVLWQGQVTSWSPAPAPCPALGREIHFNHTQMALGIDPRRCPGLDGRG